MSCRISHPNRFSGRKKSHSRTLDWNIPPIRAVRFTADMQVMKVQSQRPADFVLLTWQRANRAQFPQKDIRAVVGLHNSVFEAGFDEEGGAVKLPHAVREIEVGREWLWAKKKKTALLSDTDVNRSSDVWELQAQISSAVLMRLQCSRRCTSLSASRGRRQGPPAVSTIPPYYSITGGLSQSDASWRTRQQGGGLMSVDKEPQGQDFSGRWVHFEDGSHKLTSGIWTLLLIFLLQLVTLLKYFCFGKT